MPNGVGGSRSDRLDNESDRSNLGVTALGRGVPNPANGGLCGERLGCDSDRLNLGVAALGGDMSCGVAGGVGGIAPVGFAGRGLP